MSVRLGAVTGLLLLLRTAASGADQTPPAPAPAAPAPAAPARLPSSPVPLKTLPKTPARSAPFNAGPARPSLLKPGTAPEAPAPAAPAEPETEKAAEAPAAATPAPAVLGYPQNPAVVTPPPLGSDLRGRIKADEQHYAEKSAAARREFEQRQAAEYAEFSATLADKGFWERRRLTKAFKAAQAERLRAFNAEQEKNRRTYEWRYP